MTDTSNSFDTSTPAGQYFATHQGAGDAWAQLSAELQTYGLSGLDNIAENAIIGGLDASEAYERIVETPEYKQRFAGNAQRIAQGLAPLSETQYIANEDSYRQLMQAANFPSGFYDSPDDFASLIGGDVSPTELQSRITNGYQKMADADPQTKQALQQYFGLSEGDLAAYYIDPKHALSLLENQTTQAQIGGNAARAGFGGLTQQQAQLLQQEGFSQTDSLDKFTALAGQKQLMTGLPGQNEANISTDTQLAAAFGGDAAAQQLIKDRAAQRTAATQEGGGFVSDKNGFSGIGAKQ